MDRQSNATELPTGQQPLQSNASDAPLTTPQSVGASANGPQPPQTDAPIIFTARDSLGIHTGYGQTYLGLSNSGLELFNRKAIDPNKTLDLGVISISAPPDELSLGRIGRDLNEERQGYERTFLGGSFEQAHDDGSNTISYAGVAFNGKPTVGLRHLFADASLSVDLNLQESASRAGIFSNHDFNDGNTRHKVSTGLSVSQGQGAIISATYKADHPFSLEGGGYIRGVFTASAAHSATGTEASLSLAMLKDIATYRIKGLQPVSLEVGAGAEMNTGPDGPQSKVSAVAQLKF